MNKNNTAIIAGALILSLSACQKKDSTGFNPDNLKITIASPLASQTYKNGDTVFIRASVTYTTEMHGYEIAITNADSSELWSVDEHVHGSNFNIDTFWVNDQSKAQALNIALTVEADHDGHQKTENRTFNTQ